MIRREREWGAVMYTMKQTADDVRPTQIVQTGNFSICLYIYSMKKAPHLCS